VFVRNVRPSVLICVVLVALAAIAAADLYWQKRHHAPQVVAFSEMLRHLERGEITHITIKGDEIEYAAGAAVYATVAPPSYAAANPSFLPEVARRNVEIEVKPTAEPLGVGAFAIGLALLAVLAIVLHRTGATRALGLEQTVRRAGPQDTRVTFADVAGVDEAKEEVREIVDFLRAPQRFAAIGGRIPKGILLVGPPGTGKTLLARSIAGEAHVPFLFASGSDFVEMYAGVGARRIRKLFKDARQHPACLVFIDELDAVGRSRGSQTLSNEEREQTLNQLLVEMDGFSPNRSIVVIAATNRPDILDEALLRPGRFDRQITVGTPDLKGREDILRIHTRSVQVGPDVNLRQIARGTPGFSGAELANLVNEAALLAVRGGRQTIGDVDFDQARDKVLMGAERRSLTMSEQERTTCAYHESGHAIVAALLPEADPLHKVTIIPRGRALGVTMQVPLADRHTQTREFFRAQLAVLMAGRIAEEMFLQQMTSGAKNDIERATAIARRMVCEFGMSDALGPLAYPTSDGAPGGGRHVISESTARLVDDEVRTIVVSACDTARALISRHQSAVELLARQLLEVESVTGDDVKALLQER
jgi:cell division protease FtsH